jgi:hypothetical protein
MNKLFIVAFLLLGGLNIWMIMRISKMEQELSALSEAIEAKAESAHSKTTSGFGSPSGLEVPKGEVPVGSLQFEKLSHDFGRINEGDKVKTTFVFRNTGEVPVVISSATGSCGCTVPRYPEGPIAAGEQAAIEVEFNSSGRQGEVSKTVSVTANTRPEVSILTIKATVVPQDR